MKTKGGFRRHEAVESASGDKSARLRQNGATGSLSPDFSTTLKYGYHI